MTQTLTVWVGPAIIYLYGTVNGVAATFTLIGDGYWQAEVPRSEDNNYDVYLEAYSENGLEDTYSYTIYYGLRPPKTDWTKDDYENYTDLNRQKANIEFIATDELLSLYYFPVCVLISDVTQNDLPSFELFNTLESNLAAIKNCGAPLPAGWQEVKTWVFGGVKPDYQDANRWENNIKLLYDLAQLIKARWRPSGTFTAGQANLLPRRVM